MANNCYNLIEFWGNDKVQAQVKKWNTQLASYEPTKDDLNCARAIKDTFYPELSADELPEYGSKWVYQDEASTGSGDDELGLRSAWGNPKELEMRLACLLYPLDKNVIVRNRFNIEDGSEGVSYSTPESDSVAYHQEVLVECDYSSYEESEDAENEVFEKLLEEERDMLSDYFLDDKPHLAKIFKKRMPELDLDWQSYE